MEKRGRQIFSKIVHTSKLTRQRILEINNAHLDRSCCWQHLQEATKKTFSFTVSSQKQIKLYFSSQNWVVILLIYLLWNFCKTPWSRQRFCSARNLPPSAVIITSKSEIANLSDSGNYQDRWMCIYYCWIIPSTLFSGIIQQY